MTEQTDDGRLSFDEAAQYVRQQPGRAAFSASPIFGEDTQAAEGVRVFILCADEAGGYRMHHVAGPFFSTVFGANETLRPEEIPERVRELRFMPTRLEIEWLEGQVQVLVQKLVQASGIEAPQMPDYENAPVAVATPTEVVIPISFPASRGKE